MRRGKYCYSPTNWGSDLVDKAMDNAKSIMETIENDTVGEYVKYKGQTRFLGVKIFNKKGDLLYHEERE